MVSFNNIKKGFSLVELMLLLAIISLITAGSMSLITKRHYKVSQKVPHGKYLCYWKADEGTGTETLWEEKWISDKKVYDGPATDGKCNFVPPAKASYFYIQMIAGGGAGGTIKNIGSGYAYYRKPNSADGQVSISLHPWKLTTAHLFEDVLALGDKSKKDDPEERQKAKELLENYVVNGDKIYVCNVSERGNYANILNYAYHDGNDSGCYYKNNEDSSRNTLYEDKIGNYCFYLSKEYDQDCSADELARQATVACGLGNGATGYLDITSTNTSSIKTTWDWKYGGNFGPGGFVCTKPLQVTVDMNYDATRGDDGRAYVMLSGGTTKYEAWATKGGDGVAATCDVSSETHYHFADGTKYCWADEGTSNFYVIEGKDGDRGSCSGDYDLCNYYDPRYYESNFAQSVSGYQGPYSSFDTLISSKSSPNQEANRKKYTFTRQKDLKRFNYGESGRPGEYSAIFVRSFDKNIQIIPGKGGVRSASNPKGHGEDTVVGTIKVSGGLSGASEKDTAYMFVPRYNPDNHTYNMLTSGDFPAIMSKKASLIKSGAMSGIDTDGSELNTDVYGIGGTGGYLIDNCWGGNDILKVSRGYSSGAQVNGPSDPNEPPISYVFTQGSSTCRDNMDITGIQPEKGGSGAVIITW